MVASVALIIEDDSSNAELYSQLLQRSGYQVKITLTGIEAMNWLDANVPAMVILDMILPDVSGLEILHYIRQQISLSNVPVMVLTAKNLDERDASFELADVILSKPVLLTDFMYHAWQMLNHASTPRQKQQAETKFSLL